MDEALGMIEGALGLMEKTQVLIDDALVSIA
jgi:hypothetical protein